MASAPSVLSLHSRVRQARLCASQVMEDETILIVPKQRTVHLLNETGTEIWAAIAETASVEAVIDRLCREFEIERAAAERDALGFLAEMISKQLVEVLPDA